MSFRFEDGIVVYTDLSLSPPSEEDRKLGLRRGYMSRQPQTLCMECAKVLLGPNPERCQMSSFHEAWRNMVQAPPVSPNLAPQRNRSFLLRVLEVVLPWNWPIEQPYKGP